MKLKKDILLPYSLAIACLNGFYMGIVALITWGLSWLTGVPFNPSGVWHSYWLCYILLYIFNIKFIFED